MLVIDTPVKIGLHTSCKHDLMETLKTLDLYYTAASDNSRLFFHPNAVVNKPNYKALTKAVIALCKISMLLKRELIPNKYLIHVADMGPHLKEDCNNTLIKFSKHWNSS